MFDESLKSSVHQLLGWMRTPSWPAAAAGVAILGLLLAFHQVVSGAVRQGEVRRAALASEGEARWRCNALASIRLRDGCLVQLNAAAHEDAPLLSSSRGSDE